MAETRLREARVAQDWTQEQLARVAGVSAPVVIRAEQGLRISPLSEARLARALDTTRADLFDETEVSA